MGSIESCGCFGELIHFTPLTSFIKSVVLLMMAILYLYVTLFDKFDVTKSSKKTINSII